MSDALRTDLLHELQSVMGEVKFRDLSIEEIAALTGIFRRVSDRASSGHCRLHIVH